MTRLLPRTLRGRLSLAFAAVALLSVAVAGILVNTSFRWRFEKYVKSGLDEHADRLARIAGDLLDREGTWTTGAAVQMTHWAVLDDLQIRLDDPNGHLIWQPTPADLDNMRRMMGISKPVSVGVVAPHTTRSPVMAAGRLVGYLTVTGSRAAGMYSEDDLSFLSVSALILVAAALASALLGVAVGNVLARNLTSPIEDIDRMAKRIRRGNLESRLELTGSDEFRTLAASLNHMAEALGHEERFRRSLTADVAHELRTPLAGVRAQLEALVDGVWEPTPERLASCLNEIMRLVRLVEDLERLNEAENPTLPLRLAETRVSDLLNQVGSVFTPQMAEKGMQFRMEAPADSGTIQVDSDKVVQVLVNLMSNAMKYTPEGGVVTLGARRNDRGGSISFYVSDNGPGIPEDERSMVFERFFRGDRSRSRATGGAGIGLSIARALAERHGGRLSVDSSPGAGSTFTLTLPLDST